MFHLTLRSTQKDYCVYEDVYCVCTEGFINEWRSSTMHIAYSIWRSSLSTPNCARPKPPPALAVERQWVHRHLILKKQSDSKAFNALPQVWATAIGFDSHVIMRGGRLEVFRSQGLLRGVGSSGHVSVCVTPRPLSKISHLTTDSSLVKRLD